MPKAINPNPKSVIWTRNAESPFFDGRFPGGDRPIPTLPATHFLGGIRIPGNTFGVSSAGFSVGTFKVVSDGVWLAGILQHHAIAKFTMPAPVDSLVVSEYTQATNTVPFFSIDPQGTLPLAEYRISGLFQIGDDLLVTTNEFYDADVNNTLFAAAVDLANNNAQTGFFDMQGRAASTGYIQPTPAAYQSAIGPYYTGAEHRLSIVSRLSQGPALYGWNGTIADPVPTTAFLSYPHNQGLGNYNTTPEGTPANAVWNILSRTFLGIIVGDKYLCIGRTAGIQSGIGYQIDGGNAYEPWDPEDVHNYYWLYNMDDILNAQATNDPEPYEYGILPWYCGGGVMDGADMHDGKIYLLHPDFQGGLEPLPVFYVHEFA